MSPEEMQSLVLYRDGLMLVMNKPSGIAVHKGRGDYGSLEEDLEHLKFGFPRAPSLAHRLDRETSGCLVLGRHPKALRRLGKLFEQRGQVKKTYFAIVEGIPKVDEGEINLPLAPQTSQKNQWWVKVDESGKASTTRFKVLSQWGERALLALEPITGRTHQLRVHCAAMGFPILGDWIYGNAKKEAPNRFLFLHARSVDIPLYPKKPSIYVEAPFPEAFSLQLKNFALD